MKTITRCGLMTFCALGALAGCASQQRMTLAEFASRGGPISEARTDSAERIACSGGVVDSEQDATRFAACEVIEADLTIHDTSFSGLGAFVNLREVRGALRITNNPQLESLDGLRNLHVARTLVLSNLPRLQSLSGLEGLQELRGLMLHRTGAYTVAGLDNLTSVDVLVVTDNPKLISLSALNGMSHAGRVRIESNPRLAGQPGLLPSLETVQQPMVVKSNFGLSHEEVSRLKTRGGTLVAEASESR